MLLSNLAINNSWLNVPKPFGRYMKILEYFQNRTQAVLLVILVNSNFFRACLDSMCLTSLSFIS